MTPGSGMRFWRPEFWFWLCLLSEPVSCCETEAESHRNSVFRVEGDCICFLWLPNKLPQTSWFKTREIYSLTALEARNPKARYQQGHTPSEFSRGRFFLAFSSLWWPQVFLGGPITPISPSNFTWPSLLLSVSNLPLPFSCKDTCHWV